MPINSNESFVVEKAKQDANIKKYLGTKQPRYRSGWELAFMRMCDAHPNITEWASEDEYLEVANTLSAMSYIRSKWDQLKSIGKSDKMEKPSTGLLTIIYFTMMYDVVHLYNFDHGTSVHYWGNLGKADQPMAAVHDWSFDKRVIIELVNEGKIVYL